MRRVFALLGAVVCLGVAPLNANAHNERNAANPPNNDVISVPTHREITAADSNLLVVCRPNSGAIIDSWPEAWHNFKAKDHALLARCQYDNLQGAVDAVPHGGTNIAVMPGTYLEDATVDTSTWTQHCKDLLANVGASPNLSYADQLACPHVTQEVAILGDPDSVQKGLVDGDGKYDCDGRLCNLQIEGMGRDPTEVVFDNQFKRLNAIRGDRAYGLYIRNLTAQHTEFNGLYVIESDGYVFDSILARWDLEYGFLSFTVDHGLYVNCETYGNGDSGIYPGGQAQRFGFRPSVEVKNCSSHHNVAGTSGTAGDSVYFHDNLLYDNMTGISNDSIAAHHPGTPQNSALYVHNRIFSNNEDLYYYVRTVDPHDTFGRTYCERPTSQIDYEHGVVCPSFVWPTGTGIMTAGGNFNVFAENWIYDNWRMGADLFTVPATLRSDNDPTHQLDNSHANRYYQNYMGIAPAGTANGTNHPNGLDFWWDESGVLNCWQENVPNGITGKIYSDPPYNTEGTYNGHPSIGGRPTGAAGPNPLPVCFPPVQPAPNQAPQGVKAALEVDCSTYALHPNPSDPSQSNDPPTCAWNHAPPVPPDRVSTGFGVNPNQEVLPANQAPCQPQGEPCWSLGWVNPPDGAAAQRPALLPNNLPIIGDLPNTQAQAPVLFLLALVVFAAGLRVGRAWRRR